MPFRRIAAACFCAQGLLLAQLTIDQKVTEFEYLAGLYAKRYGPYEWKRDVLKFDLLNIGPWLDKVRATKTDLEFFDVASEYVAGLDDAHDAYQLPSNFVARLNFTVDVYDGRFLVDFINRTRLPAAEYGFVNGYELVSIDGVSAQSLADRFLRYNRSANPKSTLRFAAAMITTRSQAFLPSAPDVPEISSVVFRRPNGALETYRIPWTKTGVPLTSVGKFKTPLGAAGRHASETPDYLEPLLRLQNVRLPDKQAVLNLGSRTPVFAAALGPGFTQRLPRAASDVFFSGVFTVGPYRIGFIRIPDFSPPDFNAALASFLGEITFFQANTDGLVVDVMRNPGGSVSYVNALAGLLLPAKWTSIGFEVRATSDWVVAISSALESAKAQGAPESIIRQLEAIRDAIQSANREFRGRTSPIPLDDVSLEREPARDNQGRLLAYTKPLMVLIDEMSFSGADMFPATIQDNGRAILFGWRTAGAGGNVSAWFAGSYSLASVTITESLMSRSREVVTPDFPVTRYIENVGVRPDIEYDYMTRENLDRNGGAFVDAFLMAMYQHIEMSR